MMKTEFERGRRMYLKSVKREFPTMTSTHFDDSENDSRLRNQNHFWFKFRYEQ